MSTLSRGQSQVVGPKSVLQAKPLLSISSADFEQIWKEVRWDTKRVNNTLDLFSRFCRDDLDDFLDGADLSTGSEYVSGASHQANGYQLMSNHRLMALLKSIAIIGTENENLNMEFFTRNDLCTIMTGIPYIDKKNFLRLMCLLDRSTPHTTTSPAGLSRLKLVFSYYDWGWKGYLDEFDWKRLRSDILNSTYYGKLYGKGNDGQDSKSRSNSIGSKGSPVPETLEEGLKRLSHEMSIRSLRDSNSGSKAMGGDSLRLSVNMVKGSDGHSEYSYFDNSSHCCYVRNKDLIVDFPLFIKLVEFRIIKGTSQILRVELPGRDQEVSIARSILENGGSIFLDNYRSEKGSFSRDKPNNFSRYGQTSSSLHNNKSKISSPSNLNIQEPEEIDNIEKSKQIISEQIQELDEELNNLKMTVKNSRYPSNSLSLDVSNLTEDTVSNNAMEYIFGPPPEDLHGIFCDRPNDQQDLAFSSIVVPSSSTPIRKSRSMRLNTLPVSPSADSNNPNSSPERSAISPHDFPNNVNNAEAGGPPILL